MRFFRTLTAAAIVLLGTASAFADCTLPKKLGKLPNGKKATIDEMRAAIAEFKQYDAAITQYQSCIDGETEAMVAALGPEAKPDQIESLKKKQEQKKDTAYKQVSEVAEALNKQREAFNKKSQ